MPKTLTRPHAQDKGWLTPALHGCARQDRQPTPQCGRLYSQRIESNYPGTPAGVKISDLNVFGDYLRSIGFNPGDMVNDPQAWESVTWGVLEAFKRWMIQTGFMRLAQSIFD